MARKGPPCGWPFFVAAIIAVPHRVRSPVGGSLPLLCHREALRVFGIEKGSSRCYKPAKRLSGPAVKSFLSFGCFDAACVLILSACATIGAETDVFSGRRHLLISEYAQALPYFQRAAEEDPGYVTTFTEFPENIWTYIGRCYYQLGDLNRAQTALERSVRRHPDAILGHVYLGLVQMRQGQVEPGLRNAKTGLELLHQWFKTLDATNQFASYWDPSSVIRNTTTQLIKEIEARDVSWRQIASRLDWLGKKMEEEINLSSRDITDALQEDGGRRF